MDARVSVPSEPRPIPVATAIAEPPLEPPGIRDGAAGFTTRPKRGLSLVMPYANSCRFARPTITAPARRSRATISASRVATSASIALLPAVNGMSFTSIRSFTATGTPARIPRPGESSCSGR